jgi:two-component system chemotaxis response regulator CheB
MSVRVLIVDDSSFIREILREVLTRYPDIEVVGEASDGKRAEKLVLELRPDVVTMDLVMPLVGGMEAIRSIMTTCPTPIVVVSDAQSDVRRLAMHAIEAGAIDTFAKPAAGFDDATADRLAALVRSAAQVRVRQRWERSRPPRQSQRSLERRIATAAFIGIVASTGGPQTLQRVLGRLPPRVTAPIAIVQHTSVGFTKALAAWLSSSSRIPVAIARDRQRVSAGQIVLAPDDAHLEIDASSHVRLHRGPRINNHRPSGTLLLRSLAHAFGSSAVGVILTGMGDDGAEGAHELEERGGLVMIENPSTSILEGMPRAALQRTRLPLVASCGRIGELLRNAFTPGGAGS